MTDTDLTIFLVTLKNKKFCYMDFFCVSDHLWIAFQQSTYVGKENECVKDLHLSYIFNIT